MAESKANLIVTPQLRVVFPNLFEPSAPKDGKGRDLGEPRYSVLLLGTDQEIKEVADLVRKVAANDFPNHSLKDLALPIISGDQEAAKAEKKDKNGDFFKGMKVIKASSKFKPGVVDPNLNEIINSSDLYSGCYGRAELNIVGYNGVGQNPDGIKAYINNFQKLDDGERLVGRTAKDVFSPAGGTASAGGDADDLDDDIPI